MNKNITRLQLIDSKVKGFLDVKSGADAPINLAVSDIRDVSSRTGMYSKTITLSGTKNNNKILNNYFEVNIVDGTFNVNKKQKVALIQNGTVVKDNLYLRLLKVVKRQHIASDIDNLVEYEVQVTDGLGDFFKDASNKEIKDLTGWEEFNHIFSVDEIVESWNNNSPEQGYKYVLPFITPGSNGESRYQIGELMPAIYAKQIFDKIHEQNGMTYEWSTLADKEFQFDKSIIPYAGDKKKLSQEFIDEARVIAAKDKLSFNLDVHHPYNSSQASGGGYPKIDNEIQDELELYNPNTYEYTNPYSISNPDSLIYKINIKWELFIYNPSSYQVAPGYNRISPGADVNSTNGIRLKTHIHKNGSSINSHILREVEFQTFSTGGGDAPLNGLPVGVLEDNGFMNYKGRFFINPQEERLFCSGVDSYNISLNSLDVGDVLKVYQTLDSKVNDHNYRFARDSGTSNVIPINMEYRLRVSDISVEIVPSAQNGLMPGSKIELKRFLPDKVKQSDFLKSIYQKYNLFILVDEDDPNHLKYITRDEYYDNGVVKDWTKKLNKDKDQELIFLPDITTKKMVLSYKDDDKDPLLTSYRNETSKTFGQVSFTFENENVRGEDRKEEIFSPTISMRTEFGAVLPVLDPEFKMNVRYLQDGGLMSCGNFQIASGATITNHNKYPHISMFDRPNNPEFSIEYALSDYYAYNPGNIKKNTLYSLHWRRTLAQINEGKMFKAWFWLDETDIRKLKLNDKIKVNDTLYYINKVIDYDSNSFKPTKVELLTVEDDLQLPMIGSDVIFRPDFEKVEAILEYNLTPFTPIISGGFFREALSSVIRKRINATTVTSSPTLLDGNMGVGNNIPEGFRGVILQDRTTPTVNGIYVDENTSLTGDGLKASSAEIDGNIDVGSIGNENGRIEIDDDGNIAISGDVLDLSNITVNLPELDDKVESVTGVNGVPVDNTDPNNPVIGLQDRLPVADTRIDNENPQWYFNNRPFSTIYEFKHIGTLGLSSIFTSGSYCTIKTITQWDDSSGDYPYQIATNPGDGKMAKRYGISDTTWSNWEEFGAGGGGGSMDIVPITYTNLKNLKDTNSLEVGTRYYITNRDIWIDALDTDKLSMSAKRHFRIVKDEYYTPHTASTGLGTQSYLGIYGQTYDRGSVPYSSSVIGGTTYYAIWGGRMWSRQNDFTGSPDVPGTSFSTIQSGWTIVNENNNIYYESKIFDIKYNFDEDIIWEQADDRGNIIKRFSSSTSYIDITDWGNKLIYNNENYGVFNNFRGSLNPANIFNNLNIGSIYDNSNNGIIRSNSNKGNINSNSNSGYIINNSNNGYITSNSNSGFITSNLNNGNIYSNSNNGNIDYNTNNGNILSNTGSGSVSDPRLHK